MTTDPTILLKQLEPPISPAYAHGTVGRPRLPIEQTPFDQLLAQVRQGSVLSGRRIEVDFAMSPALDETQMRRLGMAADLAEASGARRALMLVDGRGLVLGVSDRSLQAELAAATPVAGIDTAVYVGGDEDELPAAALKPPGGIAPRAVGEEITRTSDGGTE